MGPQPARQGPSLGPSLGAPAKPVAAPQLSKAPSWEHEEQGHVAASRTIDRVTDFIIGGALLLGLVLGFLG